MLTTLCHTPAGMIIAQSSETSWRSARNLPQVHLLDPGQLNTYDVLDSDDVIFTKAAFDRFVARATGKARGAAATTLDKQPEGSDA